MSQTKNPQQSKKMQAPAASNLDPIHEEKEGDPLWIPFNLYPMHEENGDPLCIPFNLYPLSHEPYGSFENWFTRAFLPSVASKTNELEAQEASD
jgi:hypothetical protein